jgi:hypothetical protein
MERVMDKKYTHCASCDMKFKKKDEVAVTNAGGSENVVHNDCLLDWLLHWNRTEHFNTYEELENELKSL